MSDLLGRYNRSEMMLNCKQGDLVVHIGGLLHPSPNAGKILKLGRFLGDRDGCVNLWELVEGTVVDIAGNHWLDAEDKNLRPLRDSDGEDEILRLVGRPVGTPQAA